MKRRDFLKTSVVAGAALSIDFTGLQAALSSNTMAVEQAPEMVAVMGGEPEVMLDKALETLGGESVNTSRKGKKSLSNRTSAGTVHRNWQETLIRD